jgi:alpha-amylase/alpha-mannosidase (GH57 family)
MRLLFLSLLLYPFSLCPAGDLYLNLIWHQHQPLYVDPQADQLRGPWVRTHATKDYYDMAALLEEFPEIHATINLTSSLLSQLQTYYVDRLMPFVYVADDGNRAIDTARYFATWRGKTDPWIDLALKPTAQFTDADKAKLLSEPWNAFGMSGVQMARFPEYLSLRNRDQSLLTEQDLTAIKCWFYLAHFDPDFLRGRSQLEVDLSSRLDERDGKFYLRRPLTERDANRLVADAAFVCSQVIPEHRKLLDSGQLEIITTPYYHPILPLLIDSDIARICQPRDSLPSRFSFEQDARAQVQKSVDAYESWFGRKPSGMWPAEGSISEAAAMIFADAGIQWICGDMHVLQQSKPAGLDVAAPYRFTCCDEHPGPTVALVFRETNLSDRIGFTYQTLDPDSAAADFLRGVLAFKPKANEPDRLLTVILDGENAWEWYTKDMDGKQFLRALYTNLTEARTGHELICVTPTEFMTGNPSRSIPPHPLFTLNKIEELWPGSWINANFDTWIGEPEENRAWEYLLRTRHDLEASGLTQPGAGAPRPQSPKKAAIYNAYESMYAAEGSDWFWWYGADQGAPAGDRPFEEGFFSHLGAVYQHMREAGVQIDTPEFAPILSAEKIAVQESGGVMARSGDRLVVHFECDARAQTVSRAIYIVGNQPELGSWTPNSIALYDDGTHGDAFASDKIWTTELSWPTGSEIQYKYTNSGVVGAWIPSEEFSSTNRAFTVTGSGSLIRKDVFGVRP